MSIPRDLYVFSVRPLHLLAFDLLTSTSMLTFTFSVLHHDFRAVFSRCVNAIFFVTQELGLVMPSLPETRPSFAGGEDARSKPLKLMSIAPASEEAKQRLRAMKGAEGMPTSISLMRTTRTCIERGNNRPRRM